MIDMTVAATDLLVAAATLLLGYVAKKARELVTKQESFNEKIDSVHEKLDKHEMILFGDDDISGYNGIQVVSYSNRAYLKQHHDALVEENIIDEDEPSPSLTPASREVMGDGP